MAVIGLLVPAIALANHFDTSSATGTFDPQLKVSSDAPIEDHASNLNLTITQQDHEDAIRMLSLKIPSGWQLGVDQLRPSQKSNGAQNDYSCSDALGPADADGLKQVSRAEIVGKMTLVVASDATAPRTQSVTWNGDIYWLSWNPAPNHNLAMTTGVDTGTGKAYVDASWDPDPSGAPYRLLVRQAGETFTLTNPTSNSLRIENLLPGVEYDVLVYYASESRPSEMAETPIIAGSGALVPRGAFCGQLTTNDQRVWQLYTTGVDVRQLNFGFQIRRTLDGRWEIPADLTELWADTAIQASGASLLSLNATFLTETKGNWQLDPTDPTKNTPLRGFVKNPALSFTAAPWSSAQQFEGVFHPCHQHSGGSASPCGAAPASGRPDVTKTPSVSIYPGHAKPAITSPKAWDVLIGSNTTTISWKPHLFSDAADDALRGLKGYAVRVVPLAQASSTTECPSGSIACRPSTNPILVGETSPGIVSDSIGNTSLTVTTPSDGWYSYKITALYNDGHTSNETDLASVKGASTGNFYTSSTPWPFIYLDSSIVNRPMVLFIDPGQKSFSLVLTNKTLTFTDPNMQYVASGEADGSGAFTRFQQGSYYGNNQDVTMVFQPDWAKGAYTFEASAGTATGQFNGNRVR